MKKLFLASPRGFCAGVRRALDTVEAALNKSNDVIYVYHEIVHNDYVVRNLRARGVVFVDNITEVPENGIIVFSAHGVSLCIENEAQQRNLKTIDATCPLVKKIHNRGRELVKSGYVVFILGHSDHPEIKGTLGQLRGDAFVIENLVQFERAAKNIPPDAKVAYLTQTTLNINDTSDIVTAMKSRFPGIHGESDICYATANRQNAIKLLASKCDTVFVIGSAKSSNSNRLREVAGSHGARAFLVNDYTEVTEAMLKGAKNVGVSAGASAPDCLVYDLCEFLTGKGWSKAETLESSCENTVFSIPEIRV
ncbi:MAG: 4-hydroxy-3-methylbut-2-enyl diphosphate reductase [Victivallales bacterium]|nr:4-hydroxy-3-methylbut-2-enyl diphosphate reductase [Victivallales bacterium]